jgi:hypothetical protein
MVLPILAYEICQVHVAIRIEEYVVGLHVSMDDILTMDISQCTTEFCNPETDCFFCKGLSRNMKSQIAASHQIDNEIPEALVSGMP